MATYYVRPTNGDNGYAGTSFTGAWKTTQYAMDNIVAGDEVRLCNEADETPSATIDLDQAALVGSAQDAAYFIGADSVDGSKLTTGHYVIDGMWITGASTIVAGIVSWKGVFRNVRLTNAGQYNLYMSSSYTMISVWENCRFDNASGHGIYSANSSNSTKGVFINCEVDHNGGWGVSANSNARGWGSWIGCSFHHNYNGGCRDTGYRSVWLNCISYSNGSLTTDHGFIFAGSYSIGVMNCTAFGNGGDGFHNNLDGAYPQFLYNNIAKDNDGYGFYLNAAEQSEAVMDYNCSFNNALGDFDLNGGVLYGGHNLTTEPVFRSETDGSENFAPIPTGNVVGAGFPGELLAGGSGNTSMGALESCGSPLPRAIIG